MPANVAERPNALQSTVTWAGLVLTILTVLTLLGTPLVDARINLATLETRQQAHEVQPYHTETGKELKTIADRLARLEQQNAFIVRWIERQDDRRK